MTTKQTKCTAEFKAEAVRKIVENKDNITVTAKKLGMPIITLSKLSLTKMLD